jgi:hypothetical protein
MKRDVISFIMVRVAGALRIAISASQQGVNRD